VHDFRRLRAWRRARGLVLTVYRLSDPWPDRERFGLTAQARRAVISIPSNVAEGAGRGSDLDFARFVRISIGSSCELETLLTLAADLDYAADSAVQDVVAKCCQLRRMLYRLADRLARREAPAHEA
jgi:four helix bundle protein